jgi:hypothetical protein
MPRGQIRVRVSTGGNAISRNCRGAAMNLLRIGFSIFDPGESAIRGGFGGTHRVRIALFFRLEPSGVTCRASARSKPIHQETWHIRLSEAGAQALCESPKSGIPQDVRGRSPDRKNALGSGVRLGSKG